MAYQNKYLVEFASVHGHNWKIDVKEDPWAGAVTTLRASGEPLIIEFNADSDNFNDPIRSSKAVINVISETNFQLLDFYTEQDFRLKTVISLNASTYWQGFIQTGEYGEPYDCPPYPVKLIAVDGLTYLKDILYCDSISISSGVETITYYTGRQYESKIILDILAKIQITGFREYVNIYDDLMNDSVNDSPMDQVAIDVEVFKDMYCYEVLTEILKKYNACIRQVEGEIVIYRPTELTGTVYGRIFTAWNTKSSTSFTADQYINRTGTASDLKQVTGSSLVMKSAMKKIVINQDYRFKDSWIDNWEISSSSHTKISVTNYTIANWTKSDNSLVQSMAQIGEKDGAFIVMQNNYPTLTLYLYQSFGTYALETTDILAFEFEYMLYNASATARTGEDIYIEIKSDSTSNYIYGVDDHLDWDASANKIIVTEDAPLGPSGWKTFNRPVYGLPADGSYTITIYAINDAYADIQLCVRNLKFYSTSDQINIFTYPRGAKTIYLGSSYRSKKITIDSIDEISGKRYVVENAINGKDYTDDYILGDVADANIDNVIEQFAGSLGVFQPQYRVDQITLTGTVGVANLTCDGVTKAVTFNASLTQTAADFVTNQAAQYTAGGVVVTSVGVIVFFTSNVLGAEFTGATSIANNGGDLNGTVALNQPAISTTKLSYTSTWNTRGGSESRPILEIIGGEIGDQYSRPKQLVQMNIYDSKANELALNPIGNIQDEINEVSTGVPRVFIFNRGELDAKNETWNADLIEII